MSEVPLVEIIIEATSEDSIVSLLKRRHQAMAKSKIYHEFLQQRYKRRTFLATLVTVLVSAAVTIVTATTKKCDTENKASMPIIIIGVIQFIVMSLLPKLAPKDKYKLHKKSAKAARQLCSDIEKALYIDGRSLQDLQLMYEIFEGKITAYRETEESVPFWVKRKFIA